MSSLSINLLSLFLDQYFVFIFFQKKQGLIFHVNHLADDSHEMSSLVFSKNKNKIEYCLQL